MSEIPNEAPLVGSWGCPLASRMSRIFAFIMDWFVVGLIADAVDFVLFAWTEAESGESIVFDAVLAARLVVYGVSSYASYCILNWRPLKEGGQTLGMRWRDFKFIRKDRSPVTAGRILWRRTALLWPLYLIPGFNTLLLCFSFGLALRESRYSLHDDIADTAVVVVTSKQS